VNEVLLSAIHIPHRRNRIDGSQTNNDRNHQALTASSINPGTNMPRNPAAIASAKITTATIKIVNETF
jgi:hypothetical protein